MQNLQDCQRCLSWQAQALLADMEFSGGSCEHTLWLYLGKMSIVHLRFVFMSLANSADFQFPLEDPFEGRLFTRSKDLSNDLRLLIGTNALHAILNRAWGTITHLADEYGISRTFIYSLANSIKKVGEFFFKETTLTTPAPSLREHAIEAMLSLRLEGCSSI